MACKAYLRYISALFLFLLAESTTLLAQCKAHFTFAGAEGCNQAIRFVADSSGQSPGARYSWDFGDGQYSDQGPSVLHRYEAYGSGAASFRIRLVVADDKGCKEEIEKNLSLKEVPDARFGDSDTMEPFANCDGAPADTLRLVFNSLTKESNTYYQLSWGEGQVWQGPDMPAELAHAYTGNGSFPVKLTVKGRNGCSSTVEKVYFRGWNPGVPSLEMPPLPTGDCVPVKVTFNILGTGGNAPGTKYTVFFSDGSPPLYFGHPPPAGFTHWFTASSCGFMSRSNFKDAFDVSIMASNGCGQAAGTVEPIRVSGPPVPRIKIEGPKEFCPSQVFTFRDIGSTGFVANAQTGCSDDAARKWQITPSTGFSLVKGGWGEQYISLRFHSGGAYLVQLHTQTTCGEGTAKATVKILEEPQAAFDIEGGLRTGCAPFTTRLENKSKYALRSRWSISPAAGWKFVNNTGAATEHPEITFAEPGRYIVRLESFNGCGKDVFMDTIAVQAGPRLGLLEEMAACSEGEPFQVAASLSECNWSGDFISPCGVFDPGKAGAGTHTVCYTLESGAGCQSRECVTIKVAAPPSFNFPDTLELCPASSIDLGRELALVPGSGYIIRWEGESVSEEGIFEPSGASMCYDVHYTVTAPGGCRAAGKIVIKITEARSVDAGPSRFACLESEPLQLVGKPRNGRWAAASPGAPAIDPNSGLISLSRSGVFVYRYTIAAGTSCEASAEVPVTIAGLSQPAALSGLAACAARPGIELESFHGLETRWESQDVNVYYAEGWKADTRNLAQGTYSLTCRLRDTLSGCEFSQSVPLVVYSPPQAIFQAPGQGCIGTPIKFSNRSSPQAKAQWDFGDNSFSEEWEPIHVYARPGVYTVTLLVSYFPLRQLEELCTTARVSHAITVEAPPSASEVVLTIDPQRSQPIKLDRDAMPTATAGWKADFQLATVEKKEKWSTYVIEVSLANRCGASREQIRMALKKCKCRKETGRKKPKRSRPPKWSWCNKKPPGP